MSTLFECTPVLSSQRLSIAVVVWTVKAHRLFCKFASFVNKRSVSIWHHHKLWSVNLYLKMNVRLKRARGKLEFACYICILMHLWDCFHCSEYKINNCNGVLWKWLEQVYSVVLGWWWCLIIFIGTRYKSWTLKGSW